VRNPARASSTAVVVLLAILGVFAKPAVRATASDADVGFSSLQPARLLETRSGRSTIDGQFNGVGRFSAGQTIALTAAGRGGVPVGAGSVLLNVNFVDPAGAGYFIAWPCGMAQPLASSIVYGSAQANSNSVITPIGTSGQVCLYSAAATDLTVDVDGWFATGAGFTPLTPSRAIDTRATQQRLAAGGTLEVQMTGGAGGVPASGVAAVALDIISVDPASAGFVTAFPCGAPRPLTSNGTYRAGQVISSSAITEVGVGGRVCLFSSAATDVVVDVSGWFGSAAGITTPSAPTAVTGVIGNGKVAVSWNAPADPGFSSITTYAVTSNPGAKTCWATAVTSCTVEGLANGTSYTFSVAATNSVGTSEPSIASASYVPTGGPTTPDPPVGVTGVTGNGQVFVSWIAAPYNVGGTATGYTVTSFPGAKTCITAGSTSCTVSGLINGTGYTFTVVAFNAIGTSAASAPSAVLTPSDSGFGALSPVRVFDTRPTEAQGAVPVVKQRYGGGNILTVKLTDVAGVPASGVGAVSLNVTVVDPAAAGFVTVYPCGTRPLASNINYLVGQTVPNSVITPLSAAGEVCFFSSTDTHLLADVNGWFATGSGFGALSPVRVFDTRTTEAKGAVPVVKQRYGGVNILTVKLTGIAGVPAAGVGAVSLNVTVVDPAGSGFVTVYPCGDRPLASNINYLAGQTVANSVITPLSASGEVCFFSSADADLLADVNGWFATGSGFGALSPVRVFDTRTIEAQGAAPVVKQRYGGGNILRVNVSDVAGVPASGVGAVSLNVTVVDPAGSGFVTVYPCGDRPLASNINYLAGQTVPNSVITPLSASGEVCFFSSTDADLLADVNGWFAAT
jgi:Fibronectin type III domain